MSTDTPDVIYGRMKEGAHISGYSLQRAMENLRWLLEDSRYKQLSPGYSNVNEFLRDIQDAFKLLSINPEERKQIAELVKELQPKASQRAIGDLMGVDKDTVARDLGYERPGGNPPISPNKLPEYGGNPPMDIRFSGGSFTPPAIPPDDYDAVKVFSKDIEKPHVLYNSGENEWYTPPEIIEKVHKVMGGIDLDPASSPEANKIVRADKFMTIEDDGLAWDWFGRVFMNPPYSQPAIKHFTEKLVDEVTHLGFIEQAIVLVNNATETEWFQYMLKDCIAACFIKGRLRFIDVTGNPSGAPLQGQAVLYFGNKVNGEKFMNEFSEVGVVLWNGV